MCKYYVYTSADLGQAFLPLHTRDTLLPQYSLSGSVCDGKHFACTSRKPTETSTKANRAQTREGILSENGL